jgi:hypothetical protein
MSVRERFPGHWGARAFAAIAAVQCVAEAQSVDAGSAPPYGTVADGYGDQPCEYVNNPSKGVYQSVAYSGIVGGSGTPNTTPLDHWIVENNPGSQFTITLSPQASCVPGSLVSVFINTKVVVPTLTLSGVTTASDGSSHILVGQEIMATVNGVPPAGTAGWNYAWTIPGNTFSAYAPSTASATYTGFTAPNGPVASWCFAQQASVQMSCVVTPPSPGAPFTVSANVTVDGPTYTPGGDDIGIGTFYSSPPVMTANPSPTCATLPDPTASPAGYALWGASLPFQGVTWNCGVLWIATVTTPTTPAYGSGGVWNFTQLVYSPSLVLTDPAGQTHTAYWFTDPATGQASWPSPVLDAYYPTKPGPGLQYPASGMNELFYDAPGVAFKYTSIVIWTNGASFRTYILYTPPPNNMAGKPMPVPIEEMDWDWSNWAGLNTDTNLWELDAVSGISEFWSYPVWFPQWTQYLPLNPPFGLTPPYTGN